jgi:predicted dithiol-disulfide oxidoreductase (DUF899 family)
MRTTETKARLQQLYKEMHAKRAELVELLRSEGPDPVEDFVLQGPDGDTSLSSLFGAKDDLLVIHNMGSTCPYCTLWADGLNGLVPHLENRTALVLVNAETPAEQKAFAAGRGWGFRMLSDTDGRFTNAMEFAVEQDDQRYLMPGYSTFKRQADGSIVRVARDAFGPGDHYCGVWHMLPLLDGGAGDWQPKLSYE